MMPGQSHHRQFPRHRGVTLLELLVALGIVMALAAVAIPWTFGWLGGRELDNAEDRLAMQMMMARAAAREGGRAIEIVADQEDGSGNIEARWMQVDAGRDADDVGGDPSGGSIFSFDEAEADSSIKADWARLELPRGIHIAFGTGEATESTQRNKGDAARDAVEALEDLGTADLSTASSRIASSRLASSRLASSRLADTGVSSNGAVDEEPHQEGSGQTLAIFLPDGSVVVAPIFMLRTDAGLARKMRVDRTTGRPRIIEASVSKDDDGASRPEFDDVDTRPKSDKSGRSATTR